MKDNSFMPRERMERDGVGALTDTDLVMVLLGSGIEGARVDRISRVVVKKLGKIRKSWGTFLKKSDSWKELAEIPGVGRVKAMQMVSAVELGRRLFAVEEGERVIHSRADVVELCSYLKRRKQEHMVVIALNARNEVLGRKTVAIGSLNRSIVEPREIFAWALDKHAAGIILVHNHPSGNTTLSKADKIFSKRVRSAGEVIGIKLIDHVIV